MNDISFWKTQNVSMFNPLTDTLNQQHNGPLYSNTVVGTLAVDG